jgi:DNA replication protein DnaC
VLPRLLNEAAIPSRYQGCRLENFQQTSEQLFRAREITANWVREYLSSGSACETGLLFIGPPGVGKTHLAAAALAELIRRYRVRGRFIDFTTLLYQIQSTFDSDSQETKQSVLDPVLQADVLVIDELGAQKPTAWVNDVLYLLLNGRYTRKLTTLFTTNFYLEPEVPKGNPLDRGAMTPGPEILEQRIPKMLVSRLWEMALPIEMQSDDHRKIVKADIIKRSRGRS